MQLAGQLALYAMRKQPKFERGFAQQALADLADSALQLPDYFMPHSIEGAVHVRLGWSYRSRGEMQNAAKEFSQGIRSYDEAAQRLEKASDANAEKREAALERVKVWRAKCRLLSGDPMVTPASWQSRDMNSPSCATSPEQSPGISTTAHACSQWRSVARIYRLMKSCCSQGTPGSCLAEHWLLLAHMVPHGCL